jgi:hypothetical protein
MAYVKPRTDQTGHSSVDGKDVAFGTDVEATAGGFGVVNPHTNTFEVLDALPLGRQSVQLAVEAGSTEDFATLDYITAVEADALADSEVGVISDLT